MAVQSKPAPIGPWGKATAGAAGAVLANALVYPLDLCVTLYMYAHYLRSAELLTRTVCAE